MTWCSARPGSPRFPRVPRFPRFARAGARAARPGGAGRGREGRRRTDRGRMGRLCMTRLFYLIRHRRRNPQRLRTKGQVGYRELGATQPL
jgi:hypothetical protein